MSKFREGDKILVNGNLVATVLSHDEDTGLLRYEVKVGRGTDTHTDHLSTIRVEKLGGTGAVAEAEKEHERLQDDDYVAGLQHGNPDQEEPRFEKQSTKTEDAHPKVSMALPSASAKKRGVELDGGSGPA